MPVLEPEGVVRTMHGSLGFSVKAVYGAGQIPSSMKTVLFGLFSLYFYTTVLGLSGTLVGIASAVGLVWDAAIDPVIGAISDKVRNPLGRRHLFMLAGSIGMGPSLWMFFCPPEGLSPSALFAWLLGANFLVRTTMSIFCIPYYALGSEMSQDYDERTSITGIRGALGLLGTMATAALSFVVFFPSSSIPGDPKLNAEGYRVMGAACGAAMTLFSLTATLGTLSFRRPGAGEETSLGIRDRLGDFWSGMGSALRNGSFRIVLGCYSLFFLGVVVNGTLAVHFLTYYVRITESRAVSAFQLAFYVGALAGVATWLRVSRTAEKHRLLFAGTLGTAAVMGCAFFLVGEGRPFGAANLPPLLVGHGLAGFFASIIWMIPTSMLADVVDEDALAVGSRREGTFFGLFHFGEQIAAGLAILLTGLLVDRFAGLIPGQAFQSAGTVLRIGMLYSLLPAGLLALASLPVLGYSLDRRTVASIQKLLASAPDLARAEANLREKKPQVAQGPAQTTFLEQGGGSAIMPDHPMQPGDAVHEEILDFLKDIAREELELSEEQIEQMDLDMPLMEGLKLDSVTQVVLITAIEDRYGIEFELEDGEGLRTVRDLVTIIQERIQQKRASRH